jgi:hypothetical protein
MGWMRKARRPLVGCVKRIGPLSLSDNMERAQEAHKGIHCSLLHNLYPSFYRRAYYRYAGC